MIQTDVLVIGGGPAGVVSASTSKKFNPEKDVLLVREKENGVIPCGIPYIFNRLDSVDKDVLSYEGLEKIGVKTLVGKVVKIIPEEKKVLLEDGEEIYFDKLI
ncbi:MAG: NAD(P)/FAD-dependent oxidoreductase, partial [Candidatus Aenigmarchaeota archaeon]|nr:NAD(P)/FAD-dependent oxidoreductase [Candidatus Aenigmarchaeota archaeon]